MTELASKVKISAENVLDANDQALANILNKRKYDNIETLTTKNFFLSHDPGQRSKIENDNLRNYLIELGPHQVKLNNFPINKDIDKGKQNRFSSLWYKEYPHLEYSILKDSAFCYVCCLFPNGPGRENSEVAWVKNGIRTWHKMKSRGKKGKRGKLSEHFSSKSHKASLLDYCNYCNSAQHINLLLDKKQRQIVISEKEEIESNKCVIKVLIDLARTLGRQGIAFRGDDRDENGNFRQLVYFMSRHNLVLKRWLSNIKLRKYHVTYMNAKSQNDFIHLLGQDVQSKIVSEVNQASMFSIMADTTPDVSHSDKLAIAVRYVDNNCNIKERIVQICEVADKTGDGIADLIISIINNLQLDVNSVVFQGYDYASSMSSNIKGVHAKISEKLKRVVPYIPCQAHRTNTFVEHAVKRNKMASNVFEVLEMCYVFISSSTKRFSLLNSKLEFIENSLKLRNLSKTRWSARSESIQAFWISMESIVECFYEISQSDLFDKKTKDQALAILKKIVNPDFIIMLMLIKGVIAKTKILTDELQKVELNILDAKMIVLSTIQSLERNRKEEFEVHCEIDAAIKICSKYEIDALKIYEDRHRRRVTPKRYDDNPDTLCSRNIYQYYTQQLNCVLDCLIYKMNENLLASWLSIEPLSLLQQSTKTFTIKDVEKLCLLMPNNGENTDAHLFHAELEIFMNTFTKSDAPTNNEKLKLSWQRQNIFPGVFKAFKLMASAPVSVASDERTFSKLKIAKNILRSTMSDARLASLILLASEKDLVDNIDLDVLV
nr:zinc finger MYM-type protein 1-like [Hydra vulgaris]